MRTGFQTGLKSLLLGAVLALPLSACAELKGAFEPIDLGARLGRAGRIETQSLSIALLAADPVIKTVGKLEYRGGIFIKSEEKRFGGLSGLLVSADGTRLLGVTDGGDWLSAELTYDGGRLDGLRRASLFPMHDAEGKPMAAKTAVAKAVTPGTPAGLDGPVYVSFERNHRVWRYDYGKAGPLARPQPVEIPADAKRQTANGGIQGLILLDDGTLFTLSEDTRDKLGDLQGWLVPTAKEDSRHGVVFLKADRDFHPVDMAALPGGDVFVLERSFSGQTGAAMQIRRIKRADIHPLAVLDGEVLAKLDVRYSIDNMEGLALRRSETGETLLYVLSNDNFSGLQRTVLLQFALAEKGPAVAAR